jgi:carbamoylphosphate synthase small subunit
MRAGFGETHGQAFAYTAAGAGDEDAFVTNGIHSMHRHYKAAQGLADERLIRQKNVACQRIDTRALFNRVILMVLGVD